MNLVSTRIITAQVESLVKFYEKVTGIQVIQYTSDFAELKTSTATIAIGSIHTLQFFGGESVAKPAENRTTIIEFLVDDVDKEFERLQSYLSSSVVQKPTIMPWGNRSLLFRDPDGNLINFFTPITKEAVEKFKVE